MYPEKNETLIWKDTCIPKFKAILCIITKTWRQPKKIPWAEGPGGLQSTGSRRVGHDWATSLSLFTFMHWRRKWQPTPVFLPGESQGQGSLVGCRLWGHTEWSNLAPAAASIHQKTSGLRRYTIYTYYGIFLTIKKKWNTVICSILDGPREYYVLWNKSEKENTVWYHLYVES